MFIPGEERLKYDSESALEKQDAERAPTLEYQRESEGSHEPRQGHSGPRSRVWLSKKRRNWLLALVGFAVAAFLILYFAITRTRHHAAGLGWTDNLQGLPAGPRPTKQLNASSIVDQVSREQLWGNSSRYLGSNRQFEVTDTATTRVFNWTISEALAAPGAMEKPMLLINGMSPGPVLEANFGDRVIINVFNNCTNETSMHWHGQYLRGENFMDGTYSITQVSDLVKRL